MEKAGVLCPVFSLPGAYGIGDFGTCAYQFLNILGDMGASVWQVLPLNALSFGFSPYQPLSSFAGETVYVDPEALWRDGLLKKWPGTGNFDAPRVDYEAVAKVKAPFFREAFETFKKLPTKPEDYAAFRKEEWVEAYGVFIALKERNNGKPWMEWPEKEKSGVSLSDLTETERDRAELEIFLQYEFRVQWLRILRYAHEKKIRIMGDIPFYVGGDSLDVYSDPGEFTLDSKGYPTKVSGVPPDYFSETGQRWGNPLYRFDEMEKNGYRFWRERLKGNAKCFDMIRIDHFLAFNRYWEIPAEEETAVNGKYVPGPAYKLLDKVLPEIPDTEIVAEDLGLIEPPVYALRDHYNFPGMNVLQFTAFDPNFKLQKRMISYTGTHDNTTARDFIDHLSEEDLRKLREIFKAAGIKAENGNETEQFLRYAFSLPTEYVIVPVQDILGLGAEARTNVPGEVSPKNWSWKLTDLKDFRNKTTLLHEMIQKGKQNGRVKTL